ncbi:Yqey-like protein-domain-containing protein [Nemania sp. FL0031]|nr:Yqey-like protein-domain-containing protein [Nemania sp. FL0031]
MSLRPSTRIAANLLQRPRSLRTPALTLTSARTYSADAAPAPPLLQKLKADLKTAMRAKDAARLSVLRAALSATLNASKTSTPITTDAGLVSLLRKQARASAEARDEFASAGREDLVAKEAAQIAVLEEYVAGSGVEELGGEALKELVRGVVAGLGEEKPRMGDVMKALLAAGGPLDGKNVEKVELARVVKEVTGA